jgi:hypothetical protein
LAALHGVDAVTAGFVIDNNSAPVGARDHEIRRAGNFPLIDSRIVTISSALQLTGGISVWPVGEFNFALHPDSVGCQPTQVNAFACSSPESILGDSIKRDGMDMSDGGLEETVYFCPRLASMDDANATVGSAKDAGHDLARSNWLAVSLLLIYVLRY